MIFPGNFSEKLDEGVSKSGGMPILSRTRWRMFLVGASHRPRKRRRTNQENPRQNRENPRKIKKIQKDKKGRTSPDRENPPFETPVYRPFNPTQSHFTVLARKCCSLAVAVKTILPIGNDRVEKLSFHGRTTLTLGRLNWDAQIKRGEKTPTPKRSALLSFKSY